MYFAQLLDLLFGICVQTFSRDWMNRCLFRHALVHIQSIYVCMYTVDMETEPSEI